MTESDITFTPQEKCVFEHYKHFKEVWDAKNSLEAKIKNFANLAYSNIEAEVKKQADLAEMFKLNRTLGLLAIDKQDRENARPFTGECVFDFWVNVEKIVLVWKYRRPEGEDLYNLVCEKLKDNPDLGGTFGNGYFLVFSDELNIDDIASGSAIEKYTKKVLSCLQIAKQVCDERKSAGIE